MLSIYALFILFRIPCFSFLFFFNDTATTEIYTLSLHDALPISYEVAADFLADAFGGLFAGQQIGPYKIISPLAAGGMGEVYLAQDSRRSEEHTSELQSPDHLVCRLLLEKKNNADACMNVIHLCFVHFVPYSLFFFSFFF